MVNAPSNSKENWNELIHTTRQNIINKINKFLKTNIEDYIECERVSSPLTIEKNTLSKGGALYGNSSNSMFSAFLRHPNFLNSVKNLYFVGGSVHPGGGIPLSLASAKIVDNEISAK
jgi:phytoene dehydrogenase-like protein